MQGPTSGCGQVGGAQSHRPARDGRGPVLGVSERGRLTGGRGRGWAGAADARTRRQSSAALERVKVDAHAGRHAGRVGQRATALLEEHTACQAGARTAACSAVCERGVPGCAVSALRNSH